MMNRLAKLLVLVHSFLSLAALAWAITLTLQARDFGKIEPRVEVLETRPDGTPGKSVRHASELDRSLAALQQAVETRNRTYFYVKPAIDALRDTEPYLPANHLFYVAELQRLRESTEELKVKRLKVRFKDGGLEVEGSPLSKPLFNDQDIDTITKSRTAYEKDLRQLFTDIETIQKDIIEVIKDTKKFTIELTGTDEMNMYLQPGIYQLTELEFKAQRQLKFELDEIQPAWSAALEQAGSYSARRSELERTLQRLKGPAPMGNK